MDEHRKPVAQDGAAGHTVNPLRVLGASLDTLVRAQRAGSMGVEAIASRLLAHWVGLGEVTVSLEPTHLRIGEDCLVHAEKPEEFKWVLPAFMAGLRRLRIQPNARAEAVLNLGYELSCLEPSLESIEHFQEWLWADGAEGFDCAVDMGFSECLDDASLDLKAKRKELIALRIDAARSLADAFRISTQDLDAAAARTEFDLALDRLTQAIANGALAMSQEASDGFKGQAQDPVFWVEAELDLVLSHPELHSAFPARQVGHRLLDALGEESAGLLVALLASLRRRKTAFTTELVAVLERDPRAALLASLAPVNPRSLEAIRVILEDQPSLVSKALALRILHLGQADPWLGDPVIRLIAALGIHPFCQHLECSTMDRVSGVFLAKVMESSHDLEHFKRFLDTIPHETAIAVACASSPAWLAAAHGEVLEVLKRSDSEQLARLLVCLFKGGASGARVVGQALLSCNLDSWSTPALKTACLGLLKAGQGSQILVPICRSKKTPTWARLVVLQATEADPETHAEAIAFRVTDVMDVPEIREYLTKARKLAPGGKR
jgi:hypothetical protein